MPEPQAAQAKVNQAGPDLTGMTVGRFAIRARLGAGGMGEVYRADDTKLKRTVALKRISPRLRTDERYRQRFLKEAEHASRLSDQRIAGVYDVLEENDETFLVMEYVEGVTLRERLTGPLSLADSLPVAIQCAEALTAAHEKGVVHRDIKPENIMLTPKGQVKILDFGVAKRLPRPDDDTGPGSTASGGKTLSGTPAYMAPEVLLEESSDQRADIFSLGVVLYEMLAGQHPFRTESFLETSDRILHSTPLPLSQVNPQVPVSLSLLISGMLAKDPAGRPTTAVELLPDLRALEHGEALPVRLPRILRRRAPWKVTAAVVGMTVAILVVLIGTVPSFRERFRRGPRLVEVPQRKHLAVLPFAVVGGTAETAAFSKGLVETLNARLTQLTERHSLQVVPASEVRAQGVTTLEKARREFGVNLVLEGSLQQSGEMVRVTYALVDTGTRRQLRADTITAGVADPFAMEDRVVASVLGNLEIELQPPERQALTAQRTREPAAYGDYLLGRGYLQDYHKAENIESAIDVFNRALKQDPQYALAYAGLGEAYWHKYDLTQDTRWVESALTACQRASALDAAVAAGHTCLGTVYNGTGKYEQAIEQFRLAAEREPTSDDAFRGLALADEQSGLLKEAEATYRRAIALRPQYWAGYNWMGVFYSRQARYPEAGQMFSRVVALAPDSFVGYRNLGGIMILQGRYAEAIPLLERSVAIRPTARASSNLGTTYFTLRRFAEAARAYEAAVRLDDRDYMMWGNLGDAYHSIPGKETEETDAYRKAIALGDEKLRINARDAILLGYLGSFHSQLKEKGPAMGCLRRGLAIAPGDPEVRYLAAVVHNQLGDSDQALVWLEKALAAGFSPSIARDSPVFDNLRSRPRFQKLFQTQDVRKY